MVSGNVVIFLSKMQHVAGYLLASKDFRFVMFCY